MESQNSQLYLKSPPPLRIMNDINPSHNPATHFFIINSNIKHFHTLNFLSAA